MAAFSRRLAWCLRPDRAYSKIQETLIKLDQNVSMGKIIEKTQAKLLKNQSVLISTCLGYVHARQYLSIHSSDFGMLRLAIVTACWAAREKISVVQKRFGIAPILCLIASGHKAEQKVLFAICRKQAHPEERQIQNEITMKTNR